MIEILIGLLIATVAVLGWIAGNLFVCVFLTLPVVFVGLIAVTNGGNAAWGPILLVALIVIWTPRLVRRATRGY